jgi:hypothetical protein
MKVLFTNWNWMRIIRLLLGVIVIVHGVSNGEALYAVIGGMLVLMAFANVGCCGARGCAATQRKSGVREEKEIVYEEVDAAK